jgi:hypothetical protein
LNRDNGRRNQLEIIMNDSKLCLTLYAGSLVRIFFNSLDHIIHFTHSE